MPKTDVLCDRHQPDSLRCVYNFPVTYQHVDNMGEMPLSDQPFHLLGIGNGASIAAAFACTHGSKAKWKPTLRSLASVNGFATVDAQLAAVLHSAQRAFRCFPPERLDLPISFWSR